MGLITVNEIEDLDLATGAAVAFDGQAIALGPVARQRITQGRMRFEACLAQGGSYVYGTNTAPGARAKVQVTTMAATQQTGKLENFIALQGGLGGALLPIRCVRLAIMARASNALSGAGKLRVATVEAVLDLINAPPPVPWQANACSGEVLPLTWLLAPLAQLPLEAGEAMALVNGSPFASALVSDVALTFERRLQMAERLFCLSVEVAQCPLAHFDPRLADNWPDPYYRQSLQRMQALLKGSPRSQLNHQAPTSWRLLPNVLSGALQALEAARQAARISLQALKDNPTFVHGMTPDVSDAVVSSGGYHDHRAAKSIDQVNSLLLDLSTLAARQVARLLDGEGLGLPPLLAKPGDVAGAEFLAWTLTEPLESARRAALATTLDLGVHDPAGNQSDVASLAFVAWGKHQEMVRAFDACMASLATTCELAMQVRETPLPHPLQRFVHSLRAAGAPSQSDPPAGQRISAVSEPLRDRAAWLRQVAEDMNCREFNALLQNA